MNALGASYTPDGTAVVLSVVSSQATRLEARIYADGADPSERLRVPMSSNAGNSMAFETTVTVTALTAAGVVYYGYRPIPRRRRWRGHCSRTANWPRVWIGSDWRSHPAHRRAVSLVWELRKR
jgi:hypothetical protein